MSSALYFILFCLSYSFPLTSLARITHHNNTDTDSDFPLSLLKTAAMRRKSTKSDVPVAETKEEIKSVDDTSADNKLGVVAVEAKPVEKEDPFSFGKFDFHKVLLLSYFLFSYLVIELLSY